MRLIGGLVFFVAVMVAGSPWNGASAQDAGGSLAIELNKLEGFEDGCRAYLKVSNPLGSELESFELDLVTFQPDGVIGNHMLFELGPLPASKTVVRAFEFPRTACDTIASILLNDVPACSGAAGEGQSCLEVVEISSLTSEFWK